MGRVLYEPRRFSPRPADALGRVGPCGHPQYPPVRNELLRNVLSTNFGGPVCGLRDSVLFTLPRVAAGARTTYPKGELYLCLR